MCCLYISDIPCNRCVVCTFQIFLVTDLLYAFVRRDYDLYHGKLKLPDGKVAQVVLE